MGSSFAAGPGIVPVIDAAALRSGRNYAHLLAEALHLDLRDVTSSGATALELLQDAQATTAGPRPPQIGAVGADTALVTITAGGNDVGYIGAVIQGWYAAAARRHGTFEQWLAEQTDPLLPPPRECLASVPVAQRRLRDLVGAVRRRAPAAAIVLVDYLTVLGRHVEDLDDCPLTSQELTDLRRLGEALATATARAADACGAILVAASSASVEHGVGSPDPWVCGAVAGDPLHGEPIPFHPNEAGMAAVAGLLGEALGGH